MLSTPLRRNTEEEPAGYTPAKNTKKEPAGYNPEKKYRGRTSWLHP
jgi:hypothetical protein